jgi:hypothetical protein
MCKHERDYDRRAAVNWQDDALIDAQPRQSLAHQRAVFLAEAN